MGRLSIVVLAAALALAPAGCGDDDDADGGGGGAAETTTITVGTLPIANAAPMYLGMEKGFFEEEGLEIEPQVGEGGAALIPSLVSGDAQFAFVGVIPAITAVAQNVPIKIVTSSDDAAATEPKDWQTLVVPEGSPIKRVDAALLTEPFLSAVLAEGGTQIDAPSVETVPNFPNGVYVAAENYIAENGDVVDRFARAMNRSLEYAQDNPNEVRRIVPTYTETPEEAAQQMRLPVFDPELDSEGIELEAELTAKYGIVEEAPAYEDLVRE